MFKAFLFLFVSICRSTIKPPSSPIQWVPGVLSPRIKNGQGVQLATHLHLK